jgi:tetratricopeptide (TPR) repeat protein
VPRNTYEQAISLLNAGRFTEAETAWKEFVYRNPDNAAGYSKLGLTYVALGKNEEAVIALNMAVKISPDQMDAQTYYLLGSSYNALGKYAEALKALQRAVYIARARSVEPGANVTENQVLFGIHYNLGLSYHGLKRAHQAIKELEDAIKLNPQSGEAHYALGMVQLSLGDRKSAEKQLGILKNLNVSLAKKLNEVIATGEIILPSRCRTVPCF